MKTIYSLKEYAQAFPINGKNVSERTINRMIEKNQLPTRHVPVSLSSGWVIQVCEYSKSELCDQITEACETLLRNKPITLPKIVTECMRRGIAPNSIRRILIEYIRE
jgi:hypothetical protein